MDQKQRPLISVVVAAYQAERWIGETLESILRQTRPPDEVVVVDDGSTDNTSSELERFAGQIRIFRQPNGGCPAAFNTAFRQARGDYVALCGADDVWEPHKLEWQQEAIQRYPQADVLFGHAVLFGTVVGDHDRHEKSGLLDRESLRRSLVRDSPICAPTVMIRRSLFERLGPFIERFGADDLEYWFRCLRAGAQFYYDPRTLVNWRQHGANLSHQWPWMDQCKAKVFRWYEDDISDRALVRREFAPLFWRIARRHVDADRSREARREFIQSLRYGLGNSPAANAKALAWVAVLSLPAGSRARIGRAMVSASRAYERRRRSLSPAST